MNEMTPTPSRPKPIFALASWLLPLFIYLLRLPIHAHVISDATAQFATGHPSQLAPLSVATTLLLTVYFAATAALVCGLVALRRGEPYLPVYLIPLLCGASPFAYLVFRLLAETYKF